MNDFDLSIDLDDDTLVSDTPPHSRDSHQSRVVAFWHDLTQPHKILLVTGSLLLVISIILAAVFGTLTVQAQHKTEQDYRTAVMSVNRVNSMNMDIGDLVASDEFYKDMTHVKKKYARRQNVSAYATRMLNAHNILTKSGRYWPLTLDMTDADALTNTVVYFAITDETRNIADIDKDARLLSHYTSFRSLLKLSQKYYTTVLNMMTATQQVASNNQSWITGLAGVKTYPVFVISKDSH